MSGVTLPTSHRDHEVDRKLLEFLVCPVTRNALVYDRARDELVSKRTGRAFQIQSGVPVMLIDEAREIED